jgi:hypothetical protein
LVVCNNMNKFKYVNLSILLVIFSFLIPQICKADIAVGFLSYNPPILAIVIFMGVWIIEALTIRNKLEGTPQKAFFTALVVNLVTGLLGFLTYFLAEKIFIIGDFSLEYKPVIYIPIFLFISIILEAIMLHFYYHQEGWAKIIGTSFLMNVKSYLFLIVFLILEATALSVFILLITVPYFFLKSYELLSAGKEISKSSRLRAIVLITVLSFVVCGCFLMVIIKEMERASSAKRANLRNIAIKGDLASLRAEAGMYYDGMGKGAYTGFCNDTNYIKAKTAIMAQNGGVTLTCNVSTQAWCVSSVLVGGGTWCVDSSDYSGATANCSVNHIGCEEIIPTPSSSPVPTEISSEVYCVNDSDCACGRNKTTGDCFFGNKAYVDTSSQCPDFCGGIAGNLELKCVENECRQVTIK